MRWGRGFGRERIGLRVEFVTGVSYGPWGVLTLSNEDRLPILSRDLERLG